MSLHVGGSSAGNEYPGGIFINKATILSIDDISGEQLVYMKTPCDLGVKVTLNVGRDFTPTLNIAGNVKRDGATIDWGSAWVVRAFFEKIGVEGDIQEDGGKFVIPREMLEAALGKTFYKLSYCAGMKEKDPTKVRYAEWYEIASDAEGPDALFARFQKSLKRGYPKNYNAQAWESRKDQAAAAPATPPSDNPASW